MAQINRSAIVPYSPMDMFTLVDDVPRYPEFLPWCTGATEHERDEDCVKATVELSKGKLKKSFTTLNRLHRNKMIEMRLVDGPFKQLEGFWRFDPLKEGDACKVSLDLEFEFSSRIVAIAIGPVFTGVASSLVDSFVNRAKLVYGGGYEG
ncbi:MAG: type II toxin-antitoxin system RatA family toxin [bacterium]